MKHLSVQIFHHWAWTLGSPMPQSGVESAYRQLLKAWKTPGRQYHTLDHLDACLGWLARLQEPECSPSEEAVAALALCYHDAVYDSRKKDNEELSAQLAQEALIHLELSDDAVDRVVSLVLATKQHKPTTDPLSTLVLDCDLAVLGADRDNYAAYERAVRKEYAWVEQSVYVRERSKVLKSFLPAHAGGPKSRKQLFLTPLGQKYLEANAIDNLRVALGFEPTED